MFCVRCGFNNNDGATFCGRCGAPLNAAAQVQGQDAMPQQGYVPPQGYGQPPGSWQQGAPKKKKTGWIIGISAGVLLIAAAVVVFLLLSGGPNVIGTWQCNERNWVLEIDKDEVTSYSPLGIATETYEYDKQDKLYIAELFDSEIAFKADKDALLVVDQDTSEKFTFTKAAKDFDAEEAILKGFAGMWTNTERCEVIEVKEDGSLESHYYSGMGPQSYTGKFDYNIKKGTGSIEINGTSYSFTAGWDSIDIKDLGIYSRAKDDLNIDTFLVENHNPLLGEWYDTNGIRGVMTFNNDNTFTLAYLGELLTGTYTFNKTDNTGTLMLDTVGKEGTLSLKGGTLMVDGVEFTQSYVEQNPYIDLIGMWYESVDMAETLTFNADKTAQLDSYGEIYNGTFEYNPMSMTGVLTLQFQGTAYDYDFSLDQEGMHVNNYIYLKGEPPKVENPIIGVWYDVAGEMGTLTFYEDGTAVMYSHLIEFTGTYDFNISGGDGTMTLDFVDGPYTWNMYLMSDTLYTDDAAYTQNYVEQSTTPAG